MGVKYQMLLPDRNEDVESLEEPRSKELPATMCCVAKLKLDAARRRLERRRLPTAPILCADTTVALGRRIMGKPANPDEAREMLLALAGRTDRAPTAVAVSAGPHSLVAMNVTRPSRFSVLAIETTFESG